MKLTQFAVLIYLVSTFHESLAQTNSAPKQSRREPEDTENSSQENRKKIKANLGGELFLGYGFVTGFQASPDLSLELWYDKAIDPIDFGMIFACPEYRSDQKYFGIRGRHFLGNSFNFSVFAYYLMKKINCNNSVLVITDNEGRKTELKQDYSVERNQANIGVGVSIGNRWQWENFYIGGEWLGFGKDFVIKNYSTNNAENGFKLILARLTLGVSI